MLYLLDANVLIDANRDYYPIARIPEFWEWLVYHGEEGMPESHLRSTRSLRMQRATSANGPGSKELRRCFS